MQKAVYGFCNKKILLFLQAMFENTQLRLDFCSFLHRFGW